MILSAIAILGAIFIGASGNLMSDGVKEYSPRAYAWISSNIPAEVSTLVCAAVGVAAWTVGCFLGYCLGRRAARLNSGFGDTATPVTESPSAGTLPPGSLGASSGRLASIGGRIDKPGDGARFPKGSTVKVSGTFERAPGPGESVVVTTSRNGAFYPQSRLMATGSRSWVCLCDENNPGETMVHVGVADATYLAWAKQYAELGKAGKGWHGFKLDVPPEGVHFDHTITIHIEPAPGDRQT